MPSDRGFETDGFAGAFRAAGNERMTMRGTEKPAESRLNGARGTARPDRTGAGRSQRMSLNESKHMARRDAEAAGCCRQTMRSDRTRNPCTTETLGQRSCRAVATIRRTPTGRARWSPWFMCRIAAAEIDSAGSRGTTAFLLARILLYENREFVFQRSARFPRVPRLPQSVTRRKESGSVHRRQAWEPRRHRPSGAAVSHILQFVILDLPDLNKANRIRRLSTQARPEK